MAEDKVAYIVHGAKMCCVVGPDSICGSNSTRLNLPMCHGVYTQKRAFMNAGDNVFEKNISMFGICKLAQGEQVGFVSDLDSDWTKKGDPAYGAACKPILTEVWQGTHDVTKVDGKPALTTNSYLICENGGVIVFMNSGQEESE